MKKIVIGVFILMFCVATGNAQTKKTKAVVKKPVTKEQFQKALHSKKAKLAMLKLKAEAKKEGE